MRASEPEREGEGNKPASSFDVDCWFSNTEGDNWELFSYCGSSIDCAAILHWAALKNALSSFIYPSQGVCVWCGLEETKMSVCVWGGRRPTLCICACVLACTRANMRVRTETIEWSACVARNMRQVSGRNKPGVIATKTHLTRLTMQTLLRLLDLILLINWVSFIF